MTQIRELLADQTALAFAAMRELRTGLAAEDFVQRVNAQRSAGYRLLGVFEDDGVGAVAQASDASRIGGQAAATGGRSEVAAGRGEVAAGRGEVAAGRGEVAAGRGEGGDGEVGAGGGEARAGGSEAGPGEALAVCGFRVGQNLAWGRHLYIDDLSTLPAARGRGLATALVAWVHAEAARLGCAEVHLDSGVHAARAAAHRLYFGEGYRISSYHFMRAVAP